MKSKFLVIYEKEMLQFFKSRLWFMTLIFPLVITITLGYVFTGTLQNVPIVVIGEDNSSINYLKEYLNNSFNVIYNYNITNALDGISSGKYVAAIIAEYPSNFTIIIDYTEQGVAQIVEQTLSVVLMRTYSGNVSIYVERKYKPDHNLINVLPSLLPITIMFVGMFMMSHTFIREKEHKTLQNLLVSPISRRDIVLGKILSGITRSVIVSSIMILIVLLLGIKPNFNWGILFLLILVSSFVGTGFGALLGVLFDDEDTLDMFNGMLMFPLMFFSGAFYSIYMMPSALQLFSKFDFLFYAVHGFKAILLKNAGWELVIADILVLIGIGISFFIITIGVLMVRRYE